MTLEQALAFRLPGGKTLGEARREDWARVASFYVDEAAELASVDPTKMSPDAKRQWQAAMDRQREFHEAVAVVKAYLEKR
jgi:hypothetical protein